MPIPSQELQVLNLFGRGLGFPRQKVLLFLLCSVAAVFLGFVAFHPETLRVAIMRGGYPFISAAFALFLFQAWRVWNSEGGAAAVFSDRALWLWVLGCSVLVWGADAFQHKVLLDEYALQATGLSMHLDKQVAAPIRGHWLQGSYLLMDCYLDKRPYLLAYLVSLPHDITGYREANIFILNGALVPVFLGLVSRIALLLSGRGSAFVATGLLASLPLLAQSGTGGGMEMLNLTVIALLFLAMLLWSARPDATRLALMCGCCVLLSQCRYESLLYVVPVAVLILAGWWRTRTVVVSTSLILTPLFLVPAVWHLRFVDSMPVLWELQAGQESRFSSEYLAANLAGCWRFFSNLGPTQPNSPLLSVLGFASGILLAVASVPHLWRRRPVRPELFAFGLFTLSSVLSVSLFLFYYWARMDDPMASRFSLPFHLVLALLAGAAFSRLLRWRAWVGAVFWISWLGSLMVFFFPAGGAKLYSVTNMVSAELRWQLDYVEKLPKVPRLVMSYAPLPWVANRYSAVGLRRAASRSRQVEFHVREGTFHEVLVIQLLTPTSIDGDFAVAEGSEVPADWQLETMETKRLGGRLVRVSRVIFR